MARQDHNNPLGGNGKCTICGDYAAAIWHGESNIEVCRSCSAKILPTLIADALHFPPVPSNELVAIADRALVNVQATFWRAVSSRLAEDLRKARVELQKAE